MSKVFNKIRRTNKDSKIVYLRPQDPYCLRDPLDLKLPSSASDRVLMIL